MNTEENKIKTNEFIGNCHVVDFLNYCLKNGFPAQAFGLYGPEHVGKNCLVDLLAKAMLCQPGVNYFKISPEADRRDLSIEQIRDWQKLLRLKAIGQSHVIGAIIGADHLSLAAANALLKIIEEPPAKVIIFVLASSADNLLKTIQSRLLPILLKKVSTAELTSGLNKKFNLQVDELIEHAKLANGLPGLSCYFISNPKFFSDWQAQINDITTMINSPLDQRLLWLNNLFLVKKEDLNATQLLTNLAHVICRAAVNYPQKFAHALVWLAEAPRLLSGNVNQRLLFERIILSL
jgi:hypothetical protein